MAATNPIDYFEKIELQDPADIVVQQIKALISTKKLTPGDKLPSEQKLEEKLGIPRSAVRRALKILNAYGYVKTIPQSGTYVAGVNVNALGGLLSNILQLEEQDFESLVDTRYVLEAYAVELAAKNATDDGLRELKSVHQDFRQQIEQEFTSFDEDLVFHIKIAECAQNPVLKALVTLLASDDLRLQKQFEARVGKHAILDRRRDALEEHEKILHAIQSRDSVKAVEAIKAHYTRSKMFREKARARLAQQE
jgi:GntR family transcriptional regulator, transcriptional repressor for pyruvate dehydrogenase complex